jgi:ABC-type glycerol-3-phosphate transport system substrate-binding protein
MFLAGEYESAYIQRYNPRLRFGVFPIPPPASHPEMKDYGTEGGNPMIIPRGSHDPQAAWQFLSWLETTGMWQAVRHEYIGDEEAMPTLTSILDKPSLAPNLQMGQFWTWFRSSKNVRPWPCIVTSHEYADMLTTEISAMLAGQVTPEQAMRIVQDRMSKSLQQALVGWHS